MLRRDFVRIMVSIGLGPKFLLSQQSSNPAPPLPAPVPWTLGLNPKTPLPHTEVADGIAQPVLRFFSAIQMATLVRLSDVLLPPFQDKPGAVQADTPAFLDFLIADSASARKNVYSDGLNWLEQESRKKYGRAFAKLNDDQADAILKPLIRTWMNDHPPTESHINFVNIAHDDIRTATLNSKAWDQSTHPSVSRSQVSDARELYWYPIDPDIHSMDARSARLPAHVIAAPKAAHTMPQYSR